MDFFEHNIAILERRQPDLARLLRSQPASRIHLVTSRKGPPSAFWRDGRQEPVALHSRYDPLQEARQSLVEIDLAGVDYFIFLGFGLGYGLDALLEQVPPKGAHVFVVESNLEILRAAVTARDLAGPLSMTHFHVAWPAEGVELARQWQRFFDPVTARKSVYITHPPSLALAPALFRSAAEIIRSTTLQVFTDINTLVARSADFLENFVANFNRACAAPGVDAFRGRFSGVPAIVVSAGPSLDRNVHELLGCRDRAMILATDTALKPLLRAGVEPHFVLSADPGHTNYLHIKDAAAPGAHLVAEATACPATLEAFAGRTVLCTFEDSSLGSFSDLVGEKGRLRAWGSVATMCLDFALLLGCDPVVFAGQDLSFPDGRTYCSGLHWDRQWFEGVANPEQWRSRWSELRAQNKIVAATDLFGRPVESTDKLLSYWNWIRSELEKHPGVRFINATEGGILKDHVEIMSLREAVCRCCPQPRPLKAEIREIFRAAARTPAGAGTTLLDALCDESERLGRILARAFRECRLALDEGQAQRAAGRLEQIKASLHALPHLGPLVERFNQMGSFRYLRRRAEMASGARVPVGEMQDAYLEFFQSVERAGETIAGALGKLRERWPVSCQASQSAQVSLRA